MNRHASLPTAIFLLLFVMSAASIPLPVYANPAFISDAEVRAIVVRLSEAQDPEAAWQGLTAEEQNAVIKRGLAVSVVEELPDQLTITPSFAGCWLADRSFGAYSPAGVHLFTFGQHIKWCDNNAQITHTYDRIPIRETHAPFWFYREIIGDSLTDTPNVQVEAYYQGKFELCYPDAVGCVEQRLPWIRFTLNVGGTWIAQRSR